MSGIDPGDLRVEVVVPDPPHAWMGRLVERIDQLERVEAGVRGAERPEHIEKVVGASPMVGRLDAVVFGRRSDLAELECHPPVEVAVEAPHIVIDLVGDAVAGAADRWTIVMGDGVAEVVRGEPAIPVTLRSSERGTVATAHVPTHPRSALRTRSHARWTAVELVVAALRQMSAGVDPAPTDGMAPPAEWRPSWPEAGRFVRRTARRVLHEAAHRPDWGIWYRFGSPGPATDVSGLSRVPSVPGEYQADPFAVADESGAWVYYEAFLHATGKGRIDAVRLGPGGVSDGPVPVLEQSSHLSYPMVFRWRDELWMAPESAASGRIALYRVRRQPDELEPEGVLIDEPLLDPTLYEDPDGRWWLFGTMAAEHAHHGSDLLYLWSADGPLGPWEPHPQNPVVTDTRKARPAGALFVERGRLIRPAQDCSGSYGRAVVLCEVDRLTQDEYCERIVGRIEPSWSEGITGTHTLNRDGGLVVLDGLGWRRRRPGSR